MKGGHGNVQRRQCEAQKQGGAAKQPDQRGRGGIGIQVLRRAEQMPQIHRRKVRHGQPVHQKGDPACEQTRGKLVGPLGGLQQREGRVPRAGQPLLHGGGGEQAVGLERVQPAAHSRDQGRICAVAEPEQTYVGAALAAHDGLIQAERLRAQMTAQQAGVGAHGLGERVLGPARGALYLGLGGAARFAAFDLKGSRPAAREEQQAKAVEQQLYRGGQLRTAPDRGMVDRPVQNGLEQTLRRAGRQILPQRAQNQAADRVAGGETVEEVEKGGVSAHLQRAGAEISRAVKLQAQICIGEGGTVHAQASFCLFAIACPA